MAKKFDASEPVKIAGYTISDYHAEKRPLTIAETFIYSSNIATARIADELGTDELKTFFSDLGLLSAPNLDLPEVGAPIVPSPWGRIHTLTSSYGHGLAVSPVQVATAVASIVNGGFLVHPSLERREVQNDKTSIRIISSEVSARMDALLRLNVTQGTAKQADVPGYQTGGKTGTAEQPGAGGGYDEHRLISSFVGAFPMEKPEYVIFVMLDEPKGDKATYGFATAGWVAAPMFAKVVKGMSAILAMAPQEIAPEQDIDAPYRHFISSEEEAKAQRLAAERRHKAELEKEAKYALSR